MNIEDPGPEEDSRTTLRKAERDLLEERKTLLDALAALPPKARAAIPGDRELRAAIEQLSGMKADTGRRRLIRRFARRTPEDAWPELFAALDALKGTPPDAIVTLADEAAMALADTLIEGGDAALTDFLDRYWDLDRNRLRTLLRNATHRDGRAAARSRAMLVDEIKAIRVAHDEE